MGAKLQRAAEPPEQARILFNVEENAQVLVGAAAGAGSRPSAEVGGEPFLSEGDAFGWAE